VDDSAEGVALLRVLNPGLARAAADPEVGGGNSSAHDSSAHGGRSWSEAEDTALAAAVVRFPGARACRAVPARGRWPEVAAALPRRRSAGECARRWVQLHETGGAAIRPEDAVAWSCDEVKLLAAAVRAHGEGAWASVAAAVGRGFEPEECAARWQWERSELSALAAAAEAEVTAGHIHPTTGFGTPGTWESVAAAVGGGRHPPECARRWTWRWGGVCLERMDTPGEADPIEAHGAPAASGSVPQLQNHGVACAAPPLEATVSPAAAEPCGRAVWHAYDRAEELL
jgi:hypothetical protein